MAFEKNILVTLDNLRLFNELLSDKYKADLALKQDKGSLRAGDHISLVSNNDGTITISVNDMPEVTPPFKFEVAQSLASITEPNIYTIYLVRKSTGSTNNIYFEYLYANSEGSGDARFELIGDTQVPLTDYLTKNEATSTYATKTEVGNTYLSKSDAILTYATKEEVAAVSSGGEVSETTKWEIPDGKDWNQKFFARISDWDHITSRFEGNENVEILDKLEIPLISAASSSEYQDTDLWASLDNPSGYEDYESAFATASNGALLFVKNNAINNSVYVDALGFDIFKTKLKDVSIAIQNSEKEKEEIEASNITIKFEDKKVKATVFDSECIYYSKIDDNTFEEVEVDGETFDNEDRFVNVKEYIANIETSLGKFHIEFIQNVLYDGINYTNQVYREGIISILISANSNILFTNVGSIYLTLHVDPANATSNNVTRYYSNPEKNIIDATWPSYEILSSVALKSRVETEEVWFEESAIEDGTVLYAEITDADD